MKKTTLFALLLLTACAGPKNEAQTDTESAADSINTTGPTNMTDLVDDDAPDTAATFAPTDFKIVVGRQVGPVTASSTEAQLKSTLGDAIVRRDTVWGPEGTFALGTSLFGGTRDQVLIVWRDNVRRAKPEYVVVRPVTDQPGQTQWLNPNGPTIGTTLVEVEKINGKPFMLSGFGWDYGGNMTNANGGKLGGNGQRSYLSLHFDFDGNSTAMSELAGRVSGEGTFSSADPNMKKLNPTVSEMTVRFKP